MVRRDGAETRKERIAKIATYIHASLHQNKDEGVDYVPLKKTITFLSLDSGVTKEKVKGYIEDLAEIGQFEIDSVKDQIRRST